MKNVKWMSCISVLIVLIMELPWDFRDLQQASPLFLILCFTLIACILSLLMIAKNADKGIGKNVPPGSLGLPVIGETLQFLRARKANKSREWIEQKMLKYGPVFKTSLMGYPTAVLTGQAGNRFIFHNDYNNIFSKQSTGSVTRVFGRRSLLELPVEDHKRIREAIMTFLKPEALQALAGKMESVIRRHFENFWEGKESVTVWPLMKNLAFGVASELLFGLEDGQERETLCEEFSMLVKGLWSLPLDFPGTNFRRCLNARSVIFRRLSLLLDVKKKGIEEGKISPRHDLMSCMLSMRYKDDRALTEEEIIDNTIMVMIAGHDTTAVLLTHLVKALAENPQIYENIVQEHREVLAGKQPNEPIKWGEIQKLRYTWKVAQETLRLTPPVSGGFRKAIKDVQHEGYTIPKGWQLYWAAGTTHRNRKIFPEPDIFDPSHFDGQIPPYTFISFGGGPCVCPGYDFAKMESVIFLCHLVSRYRWSMLVPNEKTILDPLAIPALGLPVKLQPHNK